MHTADALLVDAGRPVQLAEHHGAALVLQPVDASTRAQADQHHLAVPGDECLLRRLLLVRRLAAGVHDRVVCRQLLLPDVVDLSVPPEQQHLLAALQQQPDELGHVGSLGHAGRLPQQPVELAGGLHLLAAVLLVGPQDDPRQRGGITGDVVQRLGVGLHLVRDLRQRRQLAPHFLARAPQHDPLPPQVLAELLGVLQLGLLPGRGDAPFPQELVIGAQAARQQRVDHMEELAPVVVDRGGGQAHAETCPAGQVAAGAVNAAVRTAQLLAFLEHHVLRYLPQRLSPAPELVVADQNDVRQRVPQILDPLLRLPHERVRRALPDVVHAQLRCEFGQLLRPVVRKRRRVHHHRRQVARRGHRADAGDCLAEAKIVGQQQAATDGELRASDALVLPRRLGQCELRNLHAAGQQFAQAALHIHMLVGQLLQRALRVCIHRQRVSLGEPLQLPAVLWRRRQIDVLSGVLPHAGKHALHARAHLRLADHPPGAAGGAVQEGSIGRLHQSACLFRRMMLKGLPCQAGRATSGRSPQRSVVASSTPRTCGRLM